MTGLRVLVTEDDFVFALEIQTHLTRLGYQVVGPVSTGVDALQLVDECPPQLILMDIGLQGHLDGIQTATEIRRQHDIPVIFLTSYTNGPHFERAMATHPYGFLIKPVDLASLSSTIEIALNQHRLARQLRESEGRFRALVESMQDIVYTLDTEQRHTAFFGHAFKLYKDPEAVFLNKTASQVLGPDAGRVHQLANERALKGENVVYEWSVEEQGRRYYFQTSLAPLWENQQVHGLVGVGRNVSELKEVQQELAVRTAKLQALNQLAAVLSQPGDLSSLLADGIEVLLHGVNLKAGWITLGNPPVMAARRRLPVPEEVLLALADMRVLNAQVLECGNPVLVSWRLPGLLLEQIPRDDNDGLIALPLGTQAPIPGVIWLLGSAKLLEQDSMQATLAGAAQQIGMAVEKERLVRAAAQAQIDREVDRLRSELIANVSHELRTPLGLIQLMATALLDPHLPGGEEVRCSYLRDISAEVDRLEELAGDLVAISQVQTGDLDVQRERLDLAVLARGVAQSFAPHLEPAHQIVFELPEKGLPVQGDANLLERVLRNLLSNAIKYSPNGGQIRLAGRKLDAGILFEVADQGIGIPEKECERVFERFYRVVDGCAAGVPGIGLGLPISRGIIEKHGGRIWIEPNPGGGTRALVSLPAN